MSRSSPHTYGPQCRLAPVTQPRHDGWLEGIPPINAQFFYSSPIPIDDPLSAATMIGAGDSKAPKHPLRPFSQGDNNALEKAWLGFSSGDRRRNHANAQRNRSPSPSLAKANAEKLTAVVHKLAAAHREKHAQEAQAHDVASAVPEVLLDSGVPACCLRLPVDVSNELQTAFCPLASKRLPALDEDKVIQEVMTLLLRRRSSSITPHARHKSSSVSSVGSRRDTFVRFTTPASPLTREKASVEDKRQDGRELSETRKDVRGVSGGDEPRSPSSLPGAGGLPIPSRPPVLDDGISGKPFLRVGTPDTPQGSRSASLSRLDGSPCESKPPADDQGSESIRERAHRNSLAAQISSTTSAKASADLVDIPVGISRLHMVSLPTLLMKPIYWSPVNDIATVRRAIWFYKDTMEPLEPTVANQLEAGYRELRPWTETWADELRCAVEVGPLGEEKVSHPLWPKEVERSSKVKEDASVFEPSISADPFCAAHCFQGEASTEGTLEASHGSESASAAAANANPRSYSNYHVIYKDGGAAFLLKPSLKPSAYYNRRPVARIAKGMTVGIPVVRGFDRAFWDHVHEHKKETSLAHLPRALAGDDPQDGHGLTGCPGCRAEKERSQVNDLVLVAHGVGQKLAERVESFHFTHAINGFRRDVNIELGNPAVTSVLREDHNGIMILPLNWRHTVSFEDGGPMKQEDASAPSVGEPGFSLKDVEPDSIPAVRSMISDVMFDIPFYMSQHKPKMIQALVREANRVYRLWCRNNPGFASKGRVHLIGHSLGSAMAIEVLSKQPTTIPPLDLTRPLPDTTFFEFDTKNLFLLGSPAAFFLLLERGKLIPRRGRMKPGVDASDTAAKDVVGEVGQFGCLAVDNIYNILAKEDPIAYLLNGTVDPAYASSLRVAYVPSVASGFFASMGNAMRAFVPGASSVDPAMPPLTKPPTVRLPSQLELEVHDFTREEICERKFYLLNDNGQIDYFLRSGGGPLEIQYLNMLSAHTSYWTNQDLIRLLCMEIGRRPGRANTLPSMRAVKATKRLFPRVG